MTQANPRLVEGTFMDKTKALGATLSKIDGKGSIMRFGRNESTGLGVLEAIEPEAELFALAEQVDLAEKAFTMPSRAAQIAYLREPSIITHVASGHSWTSVFLCARRDIVTHTATSRGDWDVMLPAKKSASLVMNKAGIGEYYCASIQTRRNDGQACLIIVQTIRIPRREFRDLSFRLAATDLQEATIVQWQEVRYRTLNDTQSMGGETEVAHDLRAQ